jgi:hypothetical protein
MDYKLALQLLFLSQAYGLANWIVNGLWMYVLATLMSFFIIGAYLIFPFGNRGN